MEDPSHLLSVYPPGMKVGPNDEDAFYSARDDLVERFQATTDQECGWVASQALNFK